MSELAPQAGWLAFLLSAVGNLLQLGIKWRQSDSDQRRGEEEIEQLRVQIHVELLEQARKMRIEMEKQYEAQLDALRGDIADLQRVRDDCLADNNKLRERIDILDGTISVIGETMETLGRQLEKERVSRRLDKEAYEQREEELKALIRVLQEELQNWKA